MLTSQTREAEESSSHIYFISASLSESDPFDITLIFGKVYISHDLKALGYLYMIYFV